MDVFIAHSEQHVLGAIKGVKCLLIKCYSEGVDQGVHLSPIIQCYLTNHKSGGRFKNAYELLHLRALKFSHVNKIHIFQGMGSASNTLQRNTRVDPKKNAHARLCCGWLKTNSTPSRINTSQSPRQPRGCPSETH